MKSIPGLVACALGAGWIAVAAAQAAPPEIFAPGVVSGPSSDADAALTPDGATVVFSRDGAILVSTRSAAGWSTPVLAPFSGRWMDAQPTLAPDGATLVFVSNRPLAEGDATHPGGNLWRVQRRGRDWGEPEHLPAVVNRGPSIWGPSIAADGSLYFMDRVDGKGPFKLWRAQASAGTWLAPVLQSLGDPSAQDVDPAVAPDESFIVFSSKRPATNPHERLFIARREGAGWGQPVDLGDAVNGSGGSDSNEGRLAPDGRTLYFASDRQQPVHYPRTPAQAQADLARIAAWDNGNQNIWRVSLAPWLDVAKKPD
jgi:Tol biopolymer transport system component